MRSFEQFPGGDDSDSHVTEEAPLPHVHPMGDDQEDIDSLHEYLDSLPEKSC